MLPKAYHFIVVRSGIPYHISNTLSGCDVMTAGRYIDTTRTKLSQWHPSTGTENYQVINQAHGGGTLDKPMNFHLNYVMGGFRTYIKLIYFITWLKGIRHLTNMSLSSSSQNFSISRNINTVFLPRLLTRGHSKELISHVYSLITQPYLKGAVCDDIYTKCCQRETSSQKVIWPLHPR